jgi:hypothetical protein
VSFNAVINAAFWDDVEKRLSKLKEKAEDVANIATRHWYSATNSYEANNLKNTVKSRFFDNDNRRKASDDDVARAFGQAANKAGKAADNAFNDFKKLF